jgi:hypothetical protein
MTEPLPRSTFTREFTAAGGDRHLLARHTDNGAGHRVRRGAYVPAGQWNELGELNQYLVRIRAVSESRRERPILSHWSAAAVLGVPIIGHWPREVHRLIAPTSGGRSRHGIIAHPAQLDSVEPLEVDGLLVTTLARTIVDLATLSSMMSGVAGADFALHHKRPGHLEKTDLLREWEEVRPKAHARSLAIIEFATHLSDSPGESAAESTSGRACRNSTELEGAGNAGWLARPCRPRAS